MTLTKEEKKESINSLYNLIRSHSIDEALTIIENLNYKIKQYIEKNYIPILGQFIPALRPRKICLGIATTNRVEGTFGSLKRQIFRENSLNKTLYSISEWNENRKLIILDSVKKELIKEHTSTEIEELLVLSNILTIYSLNFLFAIYKNKEAYPVPFTGEVLNIFRCQYCDYDYRWGLPCEHLMNISMDQIFFTEIYSRPMA